MIVNKYFSAKKVSPGSFRIKVRRRLGYETKWVLVMKLIFHRSSPNGIPSTTEMSYYVAPAAVQALHSSGKASPISERILLVKFAIIHHYQTCIKEAGKKS